MIPMTESMALLEPTFSAAMTAIQDAADLSAGIKRHWVCSLRQIAKWLDRPLEVIPARWTAIRLQVGQLHHARFGVTAKTVANHKSNAAAALRWFGKEHNVPSRGVGLSTDWAVLRDGIGDRGRRARLYGLMRYCSGRTLLPASVDDAVVADYLRYRAETSSLATNSMACRSIARAWNASADENPAWPAQRLTEPPVKAKEGPAWDQFSDGLRRDIEVHLTGLGKARKVNGKRFAPCSPKTIKTIHADLVSPRRMRQARADQAHAPVKAAVTAQLAVAIAILSFAPVRLTNLVSIELDKNLIKPGGPNSPFWLVFPHYDVKNRVNLEFTFDEDLSGLIDEYIHEFRPTPCCAAQMTSSVSAPWVPPSPPISSTNPATP